MTVDNRSSARPAMLRKPCSTSVSTRSPCSARPWPFAARCAVAIQRAFAARRRVRTGLHTDEVINEEDDFFGKNVILATRIAAQAAGGEILVSAMVQALTHNSGDIEFEAERDVALKGLSGTHRMVRVAWEEGGTDVRL